MSVYHDFCEDGLRGSGSEERWLRTLQFGDLSRILGVLIDWAGSITRKMPPKRRLSDTSQGSTEKMLNMGKPTIK